MVMGFDVMLGCLENKMQEYFDPALISTADQIRAVMDHHTARASRDRLLVAMSDHRRRRLIAYMDAAGAEVFSRDELAGPLLNDEIDSGSVREAEKRLKLELHHRHLPLMDGAGLIEYDSRSGAIRYDGSSRSDLIELINSFDSDADEAAVIERYLP